MHIFDLRTFNFTTKRVAADIEIRTKRQRQRAKHTILWRERKSSVHGYKTYCGANKICLWLNLLCNFARFIDEPSKNN